MGLVTAIMLFLLLFNIAHAEPDVVIVGNKSLPVDTLTMTAVKKIFLGRTVRWNSNLQIIVVALKKSDIHETFVRKYTGKTPAQFSNWWRRLVFTGQGTIPRYFDTEQKVIEYLAKTQGAIGYVSSASGFSSDKVKVITVTEK